MDADVYSVRETARRWAEDAELGCLEFRPTLNTNPDLPNRTPDVDFPAHSLQLTVSSTHLHQPF
jgi:hypothetical protein